MMTEQEQAAGALGSKAGLGQLPEQAGWAVEMHGTCVLFANNAEKARGGSPGATTRLYTETQVLVLLAAERERLFSMPNLMHACDALGAPADGEHCDLLRRSLYRA